MKLAGKVAAITGSASGIGRATAILFAREGARVVLSDLNEDGGKNVAGEIRKAGGEAVFVKADVSREADVKKMIKATVDSYGRLDILYNNAGIRGWIGPFENFEEEEWDRVINTNLKGVFFGLKHAIPVMISQGGGVIINTASIAGIVALPDIPAYCASKGGVIQLTKSLALRYAPQNIRINCICPGYTETPLFGSSVPMDPKATKAFADRMGVGRLIQPEEIARAALFLASDDSSSVIGSAMVVDRGAVAA